MTTTDDNHPNIQIDPTVDRIHIIRHQLSRIEDLESIKHVGRLVLARMQAIEGASPRSRRKTRASLPERAVLKLYLQISPFILVALPVIPFCYLIYLVFLNDSYVTEIVQSEVLLAAIVGGIAAFMIYFTGRFLRGILMRPANFL